MHSEKGVTGPVNLGNPHVYTIRQLAERVISLSQSPSRLTFRETPADDPRQRRPDITLACSKLDWHPSVELDEGLGRTIDYFRTRAESA